MKIEIEKGIPLNNQRGVKPDMSFVKEMEIGDSFQYPKISRMTAMKYVRLYSDENKLGFEFTSKLIGADSPNVRIWRIK